MNRRNALKNIGLSFGAMTLTPVLGGILQSCQNKTAWSPIVLSNEEADLVAALMDIILPSSEGLPGAGDLNLIQFTDSYLNLAVSGEEHLQIKKSLGQFKKVALSDNQKSDWNAIRSEELEAQVAKYLKPGSDQEKSWWEAIQKAGQEAQATESPAQVPDEAAAFAVTREIRGMAVRAYKGSEYIGENVMAYAPVPGQQKGCVDLMEATGGKAWSL
ncbi:MAG: gluconate 2-dehydrogenase subunit 3 family protein [Flavobacteriaceae bacterium]